MVSKFIAHFSIAILAVTDKEDVLRIHLTPFIPLSLKGEGGDFYKEGLTPLLNTLIRQKISPLEGLPLSSPPCGYLVKGLKGTQVHDKKMFIS